MKINMWIEKNIRWIGIIILVIAAGFYGWKIWTQKDEIFSDPVFVSWKYSKEVDVCEKEEVQKYGPIVGNRYECVLRVAAKIYKTDQELALKFCTDYSLLKIQSEQLARSLCKREIEEIISNN